MLTIVSLHLFYIKCNKELCIRFSFQMYHRQIFKLLLSNKVLDEPHQRRLFKTTDLVELFNLNEPIDGESSESDRLFRESKLTPSGFSLSKIEKMRKLASVLSKKISAIVKPTHDGSQNANSHVCESMQDEQNNNSKRVQVLAVKNDLSDDQADLSRDQINVDSPSGCNEDSNVNSDADVGKNSNNARSIIKIRIQAKKMFPRCLRENVSPV